MRKQLEAASFLPRAAEALLLPRPSQGRAEQVWEDLCPEQGTWEDFVGSGGSSVLRVCVCVCARARVHKDLLLSVDVCWRGAYMYPHNSSAQWLLVPGF